MSILLVDRIPGLARVTCVKAIVLQPGPRCVIVTSCYCCYSPALACMYSVAAVGKVPDLGNLKALLTLDLSHNNLEGPVPESLINLPALQILDISFNHLNDTLPVGQSDSGLGIADFSGNRLTLTNIILPSVHWLNLSGNNYHGNGELLDVKLSNTSAVVDLRGNPFKCSYPGT